MTEATKDRIIRETIELVRSPVRLEVFKVIWPYARKLKGQDYQTCVLTTAATIIQSGVDLMMDCGDMCVEKTAQALESHARILRQKHQGKEGKAL